MNGSRAEMLTDGNLHVVVVVVVGAGGTTPNTGRHSVSTAEIVREI